MVGGFHSSMNLQIKVDSQLVLFLLMFSFGCKFFKVYQSLVTISCFFVFFTSPFQPCKDTFMDDYDGI
jgi:hypothetical protein